MGQIYDHYMPDITVTAAGRPVQFLNELEWIEGKIWANVYTTDQIVIIDPATGTVEGVVDRRADADEHIPYWTELWPSSIALCSWLSERRDEIAGRSCLDLGCGLGLTALAATSLGARVTAVDYEFDALHYARVNAAANGISPEPVWLAMDWRHPALREGSMERIWGGDIMYETRFVDPVLSLFSHCLAPGGKAWVAEPGREVYQAFLNGLASGGFAGKKVFRGRVDALYTQTVPVTVSVWEITRR